MIRLLLLILFIFSGNANTVVGQSDIEICDNGIDDDLDGLIDLNDDDCICIGQIPVSLIPNPSFEDMTCCPTMNAQLDCAVDWIQASAPTTDYIHLCDNYLGNTNIPAIAPLPLPDGEGAVGFRDGESFSGNWKEYVGACLTEPLLAGVDYRLEFFVGFQDNVPGSMQIDIAIFGSTSCANLPFGGSQIVGCPSNVATYDQIDIRTVSGSNEWVPVTFEFTPIVDYEVMVIGPSCAINPQASLSPYFYIDGLNLAESSEFSQPFESISGTICESNLTLTVTEEDGATYQWYKDGIAIVGETTSALFIPDDPASEGVYICVTNVASSCFATNTFEVLVPPYFSDFGTTLCEGDTLFFEGQQLSQSGITPVTITAADGCDSIINVAVDLIPSSSFDTLISLCPGDTLMIFGDPYFEAGGLTIIGTNANGCDSTITLTVETYPEVDPITIDDEIRASLGDLITYTPAYIDSLLTSFLWYDMDGNIVDEDVELTDILAIQDEKYLLIGRDDNDCPTQASIILRVDRRTAVIHTPNIFSPNGDFINDYFTVYGTNALRSIDEMSIYDRWGNLVSQHQNISSPDEYLGWDGYFDNSPAAEGVYGWLMRVTFIDGEQEVLTGDVTLIR